jgi:hypothetical protein
MKAPAKRPLQGAFFVSSIPFSLRSVRVKSVTESTRRLVSGRFAPETGKPCAKFVPVKPMKKPATPLSFAASLSLATLLAANAFAQESSKPGLRFSGYVDADFSGDLRSGAANSGLEADLTTTATVTAPA